jgi:hypothetical protein
MEDDSSKLADNRSKPLDSLIPISSRLSQTLQNPSHLSILLAIFTLLQLIHNLLSFLKDLTDSLVVIPHCGLNLNKINILTHNEIAGIEFAVGSRRREIDGVFEVWELGLDVVVQVGEGDPLLDVESEAVFFVPQFQEFLVQKCLEASKLGSLVASKQCV